MIETLSTSLMLAGLVLGVWLMFIPWFMLREIRRQGKAREEEALKVITLLVRIAGNVPDRTADEAARIQARIDAKTTNGGSD